MCNKNGPIFKLKIVRYAYERKREVGLYFRRLLNFGRSTG